MEVIMVRHAKSAHDYSKWKTDSIRPLSAKGRERQLRTSTGMKAKGIVFDTIWVSPYLRARQTLGIIQETYGLRGETVVVDELKVWGDPEKVYQQVERLFSSHPDTKLLIVGHNPNLSSLVELFTGKRIDMSTSDVVIVNKVDNWSLKTYFPREELY